MNLYLTKEKAKEILSKRKNEVENGGLDLEVWRQRLRSDIYQIFADGSNFDYQIANLSFTPTMGAPAPPGGMTPLQYGKKTAIDALDYIMEAIDNFGVAPGPDYKKMYEDLKSAPPKKDIRVGGINLNEIVKDGAEGRAKAEQARLLKLVSDRDATIDGLKRTLESLKADTIQWENLTLRELFTKLTIGKWVWVVTFVVGTFMFGFWVNDIASKSSEKRLEEENESYKKQIVDLNSRLDSIWGEKKRLEEEGKSSKKQVISNADSIR